MRSFLFCFTIFIVVSCKKVLPDITNSGENTFGYLVDDSTIVGGSIDSNDEVAFNASDSQFVFILRDRRSAFMFQSYKWHILEMYIHFEQTTNYNKYSVDSIRFYQDYGTNYEEPEEAETLYQFDPNKWNNLNITYHKQNSQISGLFYFNLIAGITVNDSTYFDSSKTYSIRKGRFDLKY